MSDRVRHLLLTVGGLGHMRPASGTWGSMPAPALALVLVWLLGRDGQYSAEDQAILHGSIVACGLLFSIACVRFGRYAEERWGKDPKEVVADEMAGQSIALLALPWRAPVDTDAILYDVALAAGAFLAFRAFDIAKPPPARQMERIGEGWGVLLDDLVAGVYAAIVVQCVVRFVI